MILFLLFVLVILIGFVYIYFFVAFIEVHPVILPNGAEITIRESGSVFGYKNALFKVENGKLLLELWDEITNYVKTDEVLPLEERYYADSFKNKSKNNNNNNNNNNSNNNSNNNNSNTNDNDINMDNTSVVHLETLKTLLRNTISLNQPSNKNFGISLPGLLEQFKDGQLSSDQIEVGLKELMKNREICEIRKDTYRVLKIDCT